MDFQMGLQASHHFRRIKRLDDIIVSAESQPFDLIVIAPPSGDEKDRDIADIPQLAAQQKTIRVRQADVQQDRFDGSAIKDFHAFLPRHGYGYFKAVGLEKVPFDSSNHTVIFNNQNVRHNYTPSLCFRSGYFPVCNLRKP